MSQADRWSWCASIVGSAAFVVFWVALDGGLLRQAYRHDFLNLYTGGALAFDRHIYDTAAQAGYEQRILPEPARALVPFVRPQWYAVALHPLSWLPLSDAFAFWIAIQIVALAWTWARAAIRFGAPALLICAFALPPPLGIASGQDCALLLLLVMEAYLAFEAGAQKRAGLLLALATFKWHLFLLVPVALAVRRTWKALGCYALTAGTLWAAFAAFGNLPAYLDLLRRKDIERLSPNPEKMVSLQAMAEILGAGWPWMVVGVAVVIAVVMAAKRAPLPFWFSSAILGSLLIPPHVYGYDASVALVPALVILISDAPAYARSAAFIAISPFPYLIGVAGAPWSLVPCLALLLFLSAVIVSARRTPLPPVA